MSEALLDGVMTYEAVTDQVKIRVQTYYLMGESKPEEGQYFWAYRIEMTNQGGEAVQLLHRHWTITDGRGSVEEVSGPGVVGEQPVLTAHQPFVYTSGCPLTTSSGFMQGWYEMVRVEGDRKGERFKVEIPAFSLDSPLSGLSVN